MGPVLKFLYSFQIPFTIVVPELCPHPYWWPELTARSSARICLGSQSSMGVILAPSKVGYNPAKCMFPLWACRVSRFRLECETVVDNYVSFLFFQLLPRVPKLFTPSVAGPKCSYANDELFRFCQQCGFVRKDVQELGTGGPSKKLKIDK